MTLSVPTSERLRFRCWREGDLPLARLLWDDADVTARIGTVDAAHACCSRCSVSESTGFSIGRSSIAVMATWRRVVGRAGLGPRTPELRIYELEVHLRPTRDSRPSRVLLKVGFRYAGDEFFPVTGPKHPGYSLMPQAAASPA